MTNAKRDKIVRPLLNAIRHVSIALDSADKGELKEVVSHAETASIQLLSSIAAVASLSIDPDVDRKRSLLL